MRRSSRDLVQESHVRIVENPYVGDVVAQHRNARGPHAERPSGVAVTVEAGRSDGWYKYVNHDALVIGIDRFGASAPAPDLYEKFGLTADSITPQILEKLGQ